MSQNPRTRTPVCAIKQGDPYQTTPWDDMPQMQALFEKFSSAQDWSFLDVMAAISEMVAFYTDHDINPAGPRNQLQEMSQNKCRFCA